jgi:hypothetical protein
MINNSTYDNKMNNLHNSSNKQKTTTYDVGNPGPDLGHAQKCGRIIFILRSYNFISSSILDTCVHINSSNNQLMPKAEYHFACR